MSELKEHQFCESDEFFREYHGPLSNEMRPYYLKYEADKVIAEKDKKIDLYKRGWEESDRINEHLYAQLRHQKYKRCLAMAEMCGNAYDKWMMKKANAIGLGKDGVAYYLEARRKVSHYMRWHKRWRKIAERFKEVK